MTVRILTGDAREQLRTLPDESVHMVVTSPPYWGLRAYGGDPGMIGLEPTLDEHLANLVAVFREVRRVLREDGTLWLNYGDAYAGGGRGPDAGKQPTNKGSNLPPFRPEGFKPKDLMGLPWRVAFALQDDGWWLRSDVVWHKSNPMPESAKDRPARAHEFMFLLTKAPRYFYDHEAVKEPVSGTANARTARHNTIEARKGRANPDAQHTPTGERRGIRPPGVTPKSTPAGSGIRQNESYQAAMVDQPATRNLRDVWTFASAPFKGAHFATFPPALVEPCIKAGTSAAGVCHACGAPWLCEVGEPQPAAGRGSGNVERKYRAENGGNPDRQAHQAYSVPYSPSRRATVGWRPTCECSVVDEVLPAVVLDPFGGAGTVGLVAERLGRDAILIEINPDYADMARRRIEGDAPLLTEAKCA